MFRFCETVNTHFDWIDYVLFYFNVALIIIVFNVKFTNYMYLILIIIYLLLITFSLSGKIQKVINDLKRTQIETVEPELTGVIVQVEDNLRFDNTTDTKHPNVNKICNIVNSILFNVIGRYNTNFAIHDQIKNQIRNMIKHDIDTNRFFKSTMHIVLKNVYSELIEDHNIQMDENDHRWNVFYLIEQYEKTIEKNI